MFQLSFVAPATRLIMLKAALSWEQSNYPAAGLCSMFLQKQIIKGGYLNVNRNSNKQGQCACFNKKGRRRRRRKKGTGIRITWGTPPSPKLLSRKRHEISMANTPKHF